MKKYIPFILLFFLQPSFGTTSVFNMEEGKKKLTVDSKNVKGYNGLKDVKKLKNPEPKSDKPPSKTAYFHPKTFTFDVSTDETQHTELIFSMQTYYSGDVRIKQTIHNQLDSGKLAIFKKIDLHLKFYKEKDEVLLEKDLKLDTKFINKEFIKNRIREAFGGVSYTISFWGGFQDQKILKAKFIEVTCNADASLNTLISKAMAKPKLFIFGCAGLLLTILAGVIGGLVALIKSKKKQPKAVKAPKKDVQKEKKKPNQVKQTNPNPKKNPKQKKTLPPSIGKG